MMGDEMDASIHRIGVVMRHTGIGRSFDLQVTQSSTQEGGVHMKIKLLGIDLAKNVFHL